MDIDLIIQFRFFYHWFRQPYATGVAYLYKLRFH